MKTLASFLILTLVLTACAPPQPASSPDLAPAAPAHTESTPETASPAPPSATDAAPTESAHHEEVDIHNLPIGDGKVSTSPQVGYVFACQASFNGGGAFAAGDWIHANNTYDAAAKPTIDGAVTWPSSFTINLQGDTRVIASNDLPNHPTGQYPVSQSDDAYNFDRNPNSIRSQSIAWNLHANPTIAASPTCLPMGAVGILLTGSVLFNALDAAGRDAVAHELQDNCGGHPQQQGMYHYHNLTPCIEDSGTGHSALVGYALDGFGIFGLRGEGGATLANADFDACHGHTHAIEWDGRQTVMYHYHMTNEYPYTIGCFKGTPIQSGQVGGGPQGGMPPGGGQPPVGAPPPRP
ncbi:MAG: YHYH protein [Chloroflexota bacterium]